MLEQTHVLPVIYRFELQRDGVDWAEERKMRRGHKRWQEHNTVRWVLQAKSQTGRVESVEQSREWLVPSRTLLADPPNFPTYREGGTLRFGFISFALFLKIDPNRPRIQNFANFPFSLTHVCGAHLGWEENQSVQFSSLVIRSTLFSVLARVAPPLIIIITSKEGNAHCTTCQYAIAQFWSLMTWNLLNLAGGQLTWLSCTGISVEDPWRVVGADIGRRGGRLQTWHYFILSL